MTTGILLIAEGMPKDDAYESVLAYARDINGYEQVARHLGLAQRTLYGKAAIPMDARRWTRSLKANGAEAVISSYRDSLTRLVHSLEQLACEAFPEAPRVAVGMMHGAPSIEVAVRDLVSQGCRDFLIVPLVAFDLKPLTEPAVLRAKDAIECSVRSRRPPRIEQAPWLCEGAAFRRLVLSSLEDGWDPRPSSRLLALMPSYPKAAIQDGCVLEEQVADFVAYLEQKSALSPSQIHVAYLGSMENSNWTGPFVEKMLLGWVGGSVRDVRAIVPAFTQDNLVVAYEAAERIGNFLKANSAGLPVEYALKGRIDDTDLAEAVFDVAKRGLRRLQHP